MTRWFVRHLRRFHEAVRWRSPLILLILAAREILRPLMYWYVWHIFEVDLTRPVRQPYSKEEVDVRVYAREESAAIQTQIAEMGEIDAAEVRRRFARGDLVAIGFIQQQPVGYIWMAVSSGPELAFGTYWIARPGEAVKYGSFVVPAFRGKAIHSCVNYAASAHLRSLGAVRVFSCISVLNAQSLSLTKHNHVPVAMTVAIIRVRKLNWTFRKSFRAPLASRFFWQRGAAAGTELRTT